MKGGVILLEHCPKVRWTIISLVEILVVNHCPPWDPITTIMRLTLNQAMQENLKALAQADLMGFTLPRQYGGLNCPNLIYTMAIEIISRADASLMNIFGLQGIGETINAFSDRSLKDEFLPRFAGGKLTGGNASPAVEKGNRVMPYRPDPPRPTPQVPSIYEWQRNQRRSAERDGHSP